MNIYFFYRATETAPKLLTMLLTLLTLVTNRSTAAAQTPSSLRLQSSYRLQVGGGFQVTADAVSTESNTKLTLTSGATLTVAGNLALGDTLDASPFSTLRFTGNSVSQQLTSPAAVSVGNFVMLNPLSLTLFNHVTAGGTLTLSGGNIFTNVYALLHTGNALVRSSGQVVGNLTRLVGSSPALFPVGTALTYLPATVSLSLGLVPVSATATETNPAIGRAGDIANPLLALWKLQSVFPAATQATVSLQYPNAVRQAGFTQNLAFLARWDGNRWQSFRTTSTPSPDADPSSVAATAVDAFNEFAVFWGADDTPLPVVLQTFGGQSGAEGVALSWKTASENSSSGFALWRKLKAPAGEADTAAFQKLADYESEPGLQASNSPTGSEYRFTDKWVERARYDYKLEEISRAGLRHELRTVEVESKFKTTVRDFALNQNYPNPFNPSTTIKYALKQKSSVQLFIYNVLGQKVAELVNAEQERNEYDIRFDAARFASGVYFYRLVARSQTGDFVQTKKMMLIK